MKKALVSAAGPHMAPVLALAAVTFERFAAIHDYDLVLDRDFDDSPSRNGLDHASRAARWRKVVLLESLLPDYDFVVWFDADVMITRFDRDIASYVPQECYQAFVLEQHRHRFNPNSGVWAMRNEEMSHRFLREVQEVDASPHWADQSAVCVALGWEVELTYKRSDPTNHKTYATLVRPTEFLARTGWLSPVWNPVGYAAKWPSRAEHFASMTHDQRIAKMQRLLNELHLDRDSRAGDVRAA